MNSSHPAVNHQPLAAFAGLLVHDFGGGNPMKRREELVLNSVLCTMGMGGSSFANEWLQ